MLTPCMEKKKDDCKPQKNTRNMYAVTAQANRESLNEDSTSCKC